MRRSLGALLAALIVLAPRAACAQYGATATADRPIAAGSDVDPTASATTIDAGDRPRALETLDELLLEAPGARALRTGAYGGFSSLSLRGAEAEQTAVAIGEIPLAAADGSAFDLSTIPTWLLERVEIYRGGSPAWLGAGAIGGVLRLMPRGDRDDAVSRVEAAAGAGEFELAQGRASADVGDRSLALTTAAGATRSGGAYPYLDDGCTRFDPSDDRERARLGGDVLDASGLVHLRARVAGARLSVIGLGLERVGGLLAHPCRSVAVPVARRSQVRALAALAAEWTERDRPADEAAWRVSLVASLGYERRRTSDPLAQFGQAPRDTDDESLRITARAAGALRLEDWLDATLVVSYWHDLYDPLDTLAARPTRGSDRDAAVAALEGRAHGREGQLRWELRPQARLELSDARLFDIREVSAGSPHPSTTLAPTFRLGGVVEFVPGVALSLSGWSATRMPTLLELFGDRGYLVGNPALRPEQSLGADVGLVLRGVVGSLRGLVELRGFAIASSDLVRYRPNSQYQVVAENVARATTAGGELGVRAQFERVVGLMGAATFLFSEDGTLGRPLPLRSPVTLYLRPEVYLHGLGAIDRLTIYADVEHVEPSAYDTEGLVRVGGRTRFGAGVSAILEDGLVELTIVVRDAFDQRGQDVLGFPLPGRSFAGTLAIRPTL